jgi:transcription termination/antitermination protein NusG
MPTIPPPDKQWYVVHVLSGQEQRVRDRILRMVETEEMGDYIFEVLVPQELISEVGKGGQKKERKKKFYPGYIIVNMNLYTQDNQLVENTWYFIKETDGIIGFAGTKNEPIPMRQREVDAMLAQIKEREENVRPAFAFQVGDEVKVSDGPFQSQAGIVEEIDEEKGKLRVSVTIFGRATPVELEFWQVEAGD